MIQEELGTQQDAPGREAAVCFNIGNSESHEFWHSLLLSLFCSLKCC